MGWFAVVFLVLSLGYGMVGYLTYGSDDPLFVTVGNAWVNV